MRKRDLVMVSSIIFIFLLIGIASAGVHTLQIIGRAIDTTPPVVNIIYPINTTYNPGVNHLDYTVMDNIGADKCWYSNSSGSWNSTYVNAGINFTDLVANPGPNNWIVYCNDTSGNTGKGFVNFILKPAIIDNRVYIDSCRELNKSGNYVLNKSLNVKGDCFKIKASNITLDLNGKTVNGNGKGICIDNKGYNLLVVQNGSISDFLTGINNLGNNSGFYNLSIKNYYGLNCLFNCVTYGIYINGNNNTLVNISSFGSGLFKWFNQGAGVFSSGKGNFLYNLNIKNTYYGVIFKSSENSLAKNSVLGSNVYGIYSMNNKNDTIISNRACGNDFYDFYCSNSRAYSGNGNMFSSVLKCKEGWPVINKDYVKCK